ncbi:hypothetical protein DL96DRAFT_1617526 [Flagelloscypha sp. PMI_526]|nr:hypothetical protein DL96DRAFT_1617526 [Flagelloscypha sp. PMI_526]
MVFGRFVRFVKAEPGILPGLVMYLLLGFPFAIYITWNCDPIPTFIADHPEISFAPVSGWYGPGRWLALILSIISETATLLRAAYARSLPRKWSPNIMAVVIYCLASWWNLKKAERAIQGSEGELSAAFLPALVAASRALIFSGGVLQVYAVLLLPHITIFDRNSPPRRTTIAQVILVWITSLIPMFVFPFNRSPRDSSLQKYFPCLETDSACQSGRELIQLSIFFSQTTPRDFLREIWSIHRAYLPFLFFLSVGVVGVAITLRIVFLHSPTWRRDLCLGLLMAVTIPTFILPIGMWVGILLLLIFAWYPFMCIVEFGTVLVVATIPRNGVFPHSGISVGEMDQIWSLLSVIAYHLIPGMIGGLPGGWKLLRKLKSSQEEDEEMLLGQLPN